MGNPLTSDLPSQFFVNLRAMGNRLAPDNPLFPEWLLIMMQSESGIKPSVPNGAGAPFYGLIQQGKPTFTPLTPEQFMALSAVDQLKYVERYYNGQPVSKLLSPGNLYQLNFVPASTARGFGPDTIIAAKGGTGYGGAENAFYTSNSLLDTDGDGAITVKDLDARMAKLAQNGRVKEAISRLPPANSPAQFQANMSGAGVGLGSIAALGIAIGVALGFREWNRRKG